MSSPRPEAASPGPITLRQTTTFHFTRYVMGIEPSTINVRTELVVSEDRNSISVPITKKDCLKLALHFLQVAINDRNW